MPTIILSTFAKRDASPAERTAEIASQSDAENASQQSQDAAPEGQVQCRGLLRAHVSGVKLEILKTFQKLAAKHGGIVWAGPAYITGQNGPQKSKHPPICSSPFWAREKLKDLVREGWLQEIQWHGRRVFRVLSHAEWAISTGRCDAGVRPQSGERTASLWRERSHSQACNALNGRDFSARRSDSEDQEVQDQSLTSYCSGGRSEALRKNIAAKIAARDLSWARFLDEEDEKSRRELRNKFVYVCRFLKFEISESDGSLEWEFPLTLIEAYAERRKDLRSGALTPGRFASRIIDACKRDGILWPPAFTECRDRWRRMERLAEEKSTVEA